MVDNLEVLEDFESIPEDHILPVAEPIYEITPNVAICIAHSADEQKVYCVRVSKRLKLLVGLQGISCVLLKSGWFIIIIVPMMEFYCIKKYCVYCIDFYVLYLLLNNYLYIKYSMAVDSSLYVSILTGNILLCLLLVWYIIKYKKLVMTLDPQELQELRRGDFRITTFSNR